MPNAARKAILRALIEGVVTDLMIKTQADNVYLPDGVTTVAAKISEIIVSLNDRPKGQAITAEINQAVDGLRQEMLGDLPIEAYNTFTELAAYVAEHQEVADALIAAVGDKADASTVEAIQETINSLGTLAKKSVISESDLDAALKQKVNAASQGNHSHNNKALLDTYDQTNANIKDAVNKRHNHSNKAVLDDITAKKVTSWDGKGRLLVSDIQPADMGPTDLWAQLTD